MDEKKHFEQEIHKCQDEYLAWEMTLNEVK